MGKRKKKTSVTSFTSQKKHKFVENAMLGYQGQLNTLKLVPALYRFCFPRLVPVWPQLL